MGRNLTPSDLDVRQTGDILTVTDHNESWFFLVYPEREYAMTDAPAAVPGAVRDLALDISGKTHMVEKDYGVRRENTKKTTKDTDDVKIEQPAYDNLGVINHLGGPSEGINGNI